MEGGGFISLYNFLHSCLIFKTEKQTAFLMPIFYIAIPIKEWLFYFIWKGEKNGMAKRQNPLQEAKVVAIANQKGGMGKTTTTVNLGVGLADRGKRVLLVDADSQGDLTTSLGWADGDDLPVTLATQMEKIIRDEPIGYDYILIDCMPSLGMLTINALAAADSVIVPVQAHYLSLKGMTQLMKTISQVQRKINPWLKVDGALLTLADMRTNIARVTAENLKRNYGRAIKVYQTVIPVAVKAAETSAAGKSIYRYDKNSVVAKAYEAFTGEVMRDGEKERHKHDPSDSR